MCNRYRMTAARAEIARLHGVQLPFDDNVTIPPPELFPKRPAWVVRQHEGNRLLDVMSWGFPHTITGASGKQISKPVTNVRNLTSSFWKSALANPERRCLVPVTEFSEYGPGTPGKMPLHRFHVPDRPVFSFAGIWRPVADNMAAFAFLTCEPNPLVAPIHPKAMPVILHSEDEPLWLNGTYDEACGLAAPHPSQLMGMAPAQRPVDGPAATQEAFLSTEGVVLV